ncbi:MAG: hypothetical protein HYS83_01070 [Candidatus Blackburnbacteria bacterium]|nr:hypothetical protein [Candidatus Blackburnbacteria bacterium]
MQTINWAPIFEKYPGMWVALKEDEKTVIAVSKSPKTAFANARKAGIKVPILLRVPTESLPYVGQVCK